MFKAYPKRTRVTWLRDPHHLPWEIREYFHVSSAGKPPSWLVLLAGPYGARASAKPEDITPMEGEVAA